MKTTYRFTLVLFGSMLFALPVQAQRRRTPRQPQPTEPAPTPAPSPTPAPVATPAPAPTSAPAPAASPPEATPTTTAPPPVTASETTATPPPTATEAPAERVFRFEVGPVLGLGINLSPYSIGPKVGIEVGGRITAGPGYFAFAIRAHYERYSAEGVDTLPCMPGSGAPSSPCISPAPGMYRWALLEQTVTLGLPLSYRLLRHSIVHPYVLVQPQLVLQQVEATSFQLTNTETASRVGVLGALGAQVDLGPGGVWLEFGYRWVALQHRSTGDATLGILALSAGYRFAF